MDGTNGTRRPAPGWPVAGACVLLALAGLGAGSNPLVHLGTLVPTGPGLPAAAPDRPEKPRPTLLPDPGTAAPARPHGDSPTTVLHVLALVSLGLAVVVLAAGVVWAWRHRPRRPSVVPPAPAGTFAPGGSAPDRATLTRAVVAADEQQPVDGGAPRDRVLACWLRLEEAVASTGVVRGPGETSAELTRRVLSEYAVTVSTLTELHGLYRVARFSGREVSAGQPERAGALLSGVRRDLTGEP